MQNLSQKAFNFIEARRKKWKGEEEVRLAWVGGLEGALGIHFDAERAKKDLSYNNVIIEFKAPGYFNGSDKSAKFIEATRDRLLPYILRSAAQSAIPPEDFIGIAIDGNHVCFAQVRGGAIEHNHLLPFSEESVGLVIEACRNNYRRAVVAETLLEDFGHSSDAASLVMQALADCLATAMGTDELPKIRMLFEEWQALYGQVADLSMDQVRVIDKALRFKWRGKAFLSMPARLFVIHTYNSLVIKLLGAEIVAAHGLSSIKAPAESFCAILSDDELIERLETLIERGGLFSAANIKGFVEEAIFSWHLDAARTFQGKEKLVPALKALIGKLALYRTDRLQRQRDALRDFYQGLVPETLRKSLGEFYTPDWLVDLTVSKVQPKNWLGCRTLDPTCGSGSFLIEVLRRKRAAAQKKGTSPEDTLAMLCDEVWGFDLNPLAVQTARVNFLMEVADLLAQAPGTEIEMPVLLADAIYSPAEDPNGESDIVEYSIGSQIASLLITLPSALAFNRVRLDDVFELMGECVERSQEFDHAKKSMVRKKILSVAEAEEWDEPLRNTYDQVLRLHKRKWNGIWFRIVRNFFWSATAGKFDVIVGNPPWVRWSKLPEAYRERVKPTCEQYDIFSKNKHHGGNELDISAMITYTTGDKWLKVNGRIAFVITQAIFQNPSSAGFRNFRINASGNLIPLHVEDLKALKPFPDAANKTAVAVFQKTNRKPSYPVPYAVWHAADGYTRNINPSLNLDEVLDRVDCNVWEANPVGEEGSPWAILPPGRFSEIKLLAEPSDWVEGRKGITVDMNGVYFVPILEVNKKNGLVKIRTQPASGKRDIGPEREFWIEAEWMYPLIKGASDFEACYLKPNLPLNALVPNKGIRKADYAESEETIPPKTKRYLDSFSHILETRSTWKARQRQQGAPNYVIYNVGEFTFKPWKVIWAEMPGDFCAAVAGSAPVPLIGERPFVPDHKIYFVAFDDEMEAHYLCGILNSPMVAQYVEAHNVSIQVADIFKHMRVPPYDTRNGKHKALAKLVRQCHHEDDRRKREILLEQVRGQAEDLLKEWLKQLGESGINGVI